MPPIGFEIGKIIVPIILNRSPNETIFIPSNFMVMWNRMFFGITVSRIVAFSYGSSVFAYFCFS